jgi:hypothetical protein
MNVMSLDLIYANPDQPRREFSERKLEEGRAGTYNRLRALVNSLFVAQALLFWIYETFRPKRVLMAEDKFKHTYQIRAGSFVI